MIVAASCCVGSEVFADPFPATSPGLPPQIVPSAPEVGVTILQVPNGGNATSGATSGAGATGGSGTSSGSSSAYATLMATTYGNVAASDAQQAGVSIDALAAIGQAEFGFQNIPTANGSSSATGPWQITAGTFADINAKYALGYSASDITNPAAQAAVASYIIKDYARHGLAGDPTACDGCANLWRLRLWTERWCKHCDGKPVDAVEPIRLRHSPGQQQHAGLDGWAVPARR